MDRFIVGDNAGANSGNPGLKSNMDRFIDIQHNQRVFTLACLKSNMDRFIDCTLALYRDCNALFKIQYG